MTDNRQLRKFFDSNESFMTQGHQILKTRRGRRRRSEDWFKDDKIVRQLLLRSFPKLATDSKQRVRAARWMYIIHLYFRMNWTRGQIAEELKLSEDSVKQIIASIRRVRKGARSCGGKQKGSLGQRSRGRPKK